MTLGHQVVGVIESINYAQSITPSPIDIKFQIGQRVGIPWLYSSCGLCDYCLREESNLCRSAIFTGFNVDGGFSEYMAAKTDFLIPIPDSISDEQAAPLLCAGIVGYRSLLKADIQPGESVGLFGFGASAHICIQLLNYWGCNTFVFTRNRQHQAHAELLGAKWVGDPNEKPSKELDKVVIFAPSGEILISALSNLRQGGITAINAIHMSDIPGFPYSLIKGERTIKTVANATYQNGIDFINLAEKMKINSSIKIYPFSDVNMALQDIKFSKINGEAVLKVC
ncbi:MAG: alcohol dehydrogenase catalytic domain-containing protein [Chloroflexota bacterium]